ncbi:unnamed protein product, partial [Closterium sp. Naga37s-1]
MASCASRRRLSTVVLPNLHLRLRCSCAIRATASVPLVSATRQESPVASLDRQFSAGPAGPPRPSSDYPSRPPPPEAMPIIEPGDHVPSQGGRAAGEGDEGAWARDQGRMQEVFGAIREHRIDTVGRGQSRQDLQGGKSASGRITLAQLKELLSLHARGSGDSSSSSSSSTPVTSGFDSLATRFAVDASLLAK